VYGDGRIGLDEAGPRVSSGSERLRLTQLVEPSESEKRVISRSKGFGSAYDRRRRKTKVSALLVLAAALVIVSAFAVAALGRESQTKAGIRALPVASFTIGVAGATVTVDGSGSTGDTTLTYLWNWSDNVTSGGVTSSHYYLKTLDYRITLTVTDTLNQTGTSSQVQHVVNNAIPPLPYTVYGFTYASDGVTPLPGSTVTIYDARSGMTLVNQTPSDSSGFYSADIMPIMNGAAAIDGDNLIVNATGPSAEAGSNTGVVDTVAPYLEIDVTLTGTVIPEFVDIAIPIAGMISIFAVARVMSSRREEERL
jgi:hypothetical protein